MRQKMEDHSSESYDVLASSNVLMKLYACLTEHFRYPGNHYISPILPISSFILPL